ncbi:MAG: hypothetical protein ACOCV8_04915 [Spirochaetota bacterium]
MTVESMIKMFIASIKDRNLDGEYLMLMRAEEPSKIFNAGFETIIDLSIKYNKKGIGDTVSGVLFAKELAELSHTLCGDSAYKLSLWTFHNSFPNAKLPVRTNLLKMEDAEGDKEKLLKKALKGVKDLNEVVSYSATTHYLNLCETKAEKIDYLIRLNSGFFDFGGVYLSQLGVYLKYIVEKDIDILDKMISGIAKRYAFINRIDTQPQLQEVRETLKKSVISILEKESTERILSREEIHGASEGFLMLEYNEVNELVEELFSRGIGRDEFFNILRLAALKRALLFNHKNRDFRANKSMGWLLSIAGINYLQGIKYIKDAADKVQLSIDIEILADWYINAIWLILDSKKVSLQNQELVDRLDAISSNNIKENDVFTYEKMGELARHLYSGKAIREAFGFVYQNPESSFEVVCEMINYLFEYDNGDPLVESAFMRLSTALVDIVRNAFATMLGAYSSALIALTLSNRSIFNFGQGHSRYELVREMAKMFG